MQPPLYRMPKRGTLVPVLSPREQEEKATRDAAKRMARPNQGQGFVAAPSAIKPPPAPPNKSQQYFARHAETRRQQAINNKNRQDALNERNKGSVFNTPISGIVKDAADYLQTPLKEIQEAKKSGKPIGPVENLLQKPLLPSSSKEPSYDKAVPMTPSTQRPALQPGQKLDGFGEPYTPGGPLKMDGFDPNQGGFTAEGNGSFEIPSSASEGGVYNAGVNDITLPSATFTPHPSSGSHQYFPITETGKFLRRERQRRDGRDTMHPVPTVESLGLLSSIAEQSPQPVPRSSQSVPPSLGSLATEFATEPESSSNLPRVPEFLEQAATGRTSPSTSSLPVQPNFIDRTNSHMQRPVLRNEMMPYEQTGRVPMSPGVNESFVSGLPSRSERNRSSMQPSGMGSGDTFDAMAAREREARLAPQRALAQREDVTAEDNEGFTRTVDRDPNSPTFGQAKVVGDPMFGPTVPSSVRDFVEGGGNLNSQEGRGYRKLLNESREPRRKARLAGEVYTDPTTGAVSDYGKFNEYRKRLAEGPTLENMSDQRKLRMRRAQLMNYGRTGGVTVAPGGGIAGPMTVGTQATFGPNMSLNQATRMAQGQLDQESRLRQAEQRKQDAERTETLKSLAEQGDIEAANALRRKAGIPVDSDQEAIDKAISSGEIPSAPGQNVPMGRVPLKDREQMAYQVQGIISGKLSDEQKKMAILRLHPDLDTIDGINALQNNTYYDEFGPQEYLLTEELKRIMGIESKPKPSAGPRTPANQGIVPSMPAFM